MAQSVRLMMALAIFLSYGLQFYVPISIMGPWVRSYFNSDQSQYVSDLALRIALIIVTCKYFCCFVKRFVKRLFFKKSIFYITSHNCQISVETEALSAVGVVIPFIK